MKKQDAFKNRFRRGARRLAVGAVAVSALAGALFLLSGCKDDEESREALSAVLTENVKIAESDYTAESYAVYKEAYEKAMTAYENKKSEKELLDSVKKGMEDAIGALVKRADFTALNALLAESYEEENYTKESYQAYKTAYDKAKAVSGETDSKQSVVNSARDVLKKAIDGLQKKADVSRLASLVMGLISQDGYTTASYNRYILVYDEARDLYNQYDEEMSEEQAKDFEQNVSICILELDNAIAGLEKKGDLKALRELYEKLSPAYTTPTEATGGYAPERYYTPESYTAFGAALEEAIGILDTGDYSDKQIEECRKKLQETYDGLQPRSDTAELEAQILSATKYYLTDTALYTKESYLALNNAVNEAKDLIGEEGKNPTQESVDQALQAILAAIGGLQPANPAGGVISPYRFESAALKCGSVASTVGEYLRSNAAFNAAVLALPADTATVTSTTDGVRAKFTSGIEAVFSFGSIQIGMQEGVTAISGDSRTVSVAGVYLGMSQSDVLNALDSVPTDSKTDGGKTVMTYLDGKNGCELQITLDTAANTVTSVYCFMGA